MGQKILVIDDEEKISQLLSLHLNKEGYEVDTANNGKEGLERLEKDPTYACVLTDIEMPVMDGFEVLKRCHADYPKIPVIIVTGKGTVDRAVDALRSGAVGFIEKPFKAEQIQKVVREVLSLHSRTNRKEIVLPHVERKWTLEIPSSTNVVPSVVDVLVNGMNSMNLIAPGKEDDIRLTITEAIHNAIIHGNKNDSNKKVFINANATQAHILISIQDEGTGFVPMDHIDDTNFDSPVWDESTGLKKIFEESKKVVFNAKGNQIIFILERKEN